MRDEPHRATASVTRARKCAAFVVLLAASAAFVWTVAWPLMS